ncbi:MAG: DegT/DnrJ/EryC1/StrS family aminotransferase [Deltaproteobacteria bacterium]|nr:DegT/DnrJ/EryC1/StrS family aminotransferase [Deltaproteobacteria bacterium]
MDFIPYGRQSIDRDDEAAVLDALRSPLLTTGPRVAQFEQDMCQYLGVPFAVAVSNGTAALHCAVHAAGIGKGDEVILSPLTFAASANCVLYLGATPVFADVLADTLLIAPVDVEKKITSRTRAIIAVDYAGQPCDYTALRELCNRYHLVLIADCAHSLGATYGDRSCAFHADLATYSFHPVKHITSGEGGLVTTHRKEWADAMRRFRNHGIDADHAQRSREGTWRYTMKTLGYNYRITDIQCALASSQLKKIDGWLERRQQIAKQYDAAFAGDHRLDPLYVHENRTHAYHLYVLRLAEQYGANARQQLFDFLRSRRIGVNVHYIPVYQHDYYVQHHNGGYVHCPNTESACERIMSLPMFNSLSDDAVARVIAAVQQGLSDLP